MFMIDTKNLGRKKSFAELLDVTTLNIPERCRHLHTERRAHRQGVGHALSSPARTRINRPTYLSPDEDLSTLDSASNCCSDLAAVVGAHFGGPLAPDM